MTVTINGSGTITGVTTMGTTVVNQVLTTPTVTSTMGVGNATPAASGAGITFPATQSASSDANTLDDYEEGSFTAQLADNTSGGNAYNVGGTYIKIGRLVQIQIASYALATGTFTAGNQIYIRNLPFTTSGEGCAGAFELNTTAADRAVYAWQPNGYTYFTVRRVNWTNGIVGSDMQATTFIYGNFTYQST
jgi:hypothetical protein